MSILLSSADTVLPGVNYSRLPGGLDVRESLPAAEQELCFLLTSPFIEPERSFGIDVECDYARMIETICKA